MSKLQRAVNNIRKKGAFTRGLLGNAAAEIEVSGRPGYYYVRLEKPGGYEEAIFPGRVRPLLNLPVFVATDPLTGVQFIAGVDDAMLNYAGTDPGDVPALERHETTHGWGGDDQLMWLHTLQIFPVSCRPHPTDPDSVVIQGGVFLSQAQLCWLADPIEVDLSSYRQTNTRYVILSLTPSKTVTVTETSARNVDEITALPGGGAYLVAAVGLRGAAAIDYPDIADLRFLNSGVVNGGIEVADTYIIVGDQSAGRYTRLGYLADGDFNLPGYLTGYKAVDSTDMVALFTQRTAADEVVARLIWGDNSDLGGEDYFYISFYDCLIGDTVDIAQFNPRTGGMTLYGNIAAAAPLTIENADATGLAGAVGRNASAQEGAWYLDPTGDLYLYSSVAGKSTFVGGVDGLVEIAAGDIIMETGATVDGVDLSELGSVYQPLDADLTAIAGIAVARGSLIVGNATPAWSGLPLGGISGSVLTRDASDVGWSAGALAFGGAYTLTIPATGTAALLATANIFTVPQSIHGSTNASQLVVRASAGQTNANQLIKIADSSGTVLTALHSDNQANLFIGRDAGKNNTVTGIGAEGLYNVFVGDESGRDNTTGGYNVFIGYRTGRVATTAQACFFLGFKVGAVATNALNCVGIGYASQLALTSGIDVISIGASAGRAVTTARYVTNIGGAAGRYNETGYGSVNIGYEAGYGSAGSNPAYCVNVGYRAGKNSITSNRLYIANSDTATPLIYGEFDNGLVRIHNPLTSAGVNEVLGLTALGSGANGDGGALIWRGKSSTTAAQLQGQISALWNVATHASAVSDVAFYAAYNDGVNIVLSEFLRGRAGANPLLGFFGQTPAARQTLAAYTSDPESTVYTGIDNTQAGAVYAQVGDLNALRVAYETLRAMTEDLRSKLATSTLVATP